MRIYMVAFSEKGRALAEKIQNISLSVDYGNVLCEGKKVQEKTIVYLREKEPLDVWVDLAFMQGMPLVFIGAAGIAVRAIAPFIEKKTVDSPVLVIDENAQYVVPVLSGHLGGANELARQLAEGLHGHAVVTTATDCAGCFAVDLFAKKNCLRVFDTRGIAAVSTQILQGNTVSVAVEHYSAQQLEQLRMPKELLPVDWEDFRQKKQDAIIVVTEEKELLQQAPFGEKIRIKIDKRDRKSVDKFWEWTRKGAPVILEIGPRDVAEDNVMVKERLRLGTPEGKAVVKRDEFVRTIAERLEKLQKEMFAKARARLEKNVRTDIKTKKEFEEYFANSNVWIEEGKAGKVAFVRGKWSGDPNSEELLKAMKITIRCIPFDQSGTKGECLLTGKQDAEIDVIYARSY